MTENTLLEVDGVTKQFGGIQAVDNVDLQVQDNEILGLIGPNGAGKSTLMNLISGEYAVSDGTISFEQENITNLASYEVANRGIARTFQTVRHFDLYSAHRNIEMAMYDKSVFSRQTFFSAIKNSKKNTQRDIEAVVDKVGLDTSKLEMLPSEMSHLDRTRLSLARVLVRDPSLLLLDEPFAGLTADEVESLASALTNLRDSENKTIILIDHNIDKMSSLSDRFVVLQKGRIIKEGTPDEVLDADHVKQAYLGT
jgi:branched-chain amino acid transport system ATP-binding protein